VSAAPAAGFPSAEAGDADVKQIGVYLESSLAGALGGAQTHTAVLLEALSKEHSVELIVLSPDFDLKALARASSTDLSGVALTVATIPKGSSSPVFNREYDVFVAVVHGIPPICPAKVGVLMVLFPLSRDIYWPWCAGDSGAWLWRKTRQAYYEILWKRRIAAYKVNIANSEFTRRWTQLRWGIESTVVYPPVDLATGSGEKRDLILSVGRYTPVGLSKNQKEMLTAYTALRERTGTNWGYCCAGAVSSLPESQRYFLECTEIANRSGAQTLANVPPAELRNLYAAAKIFWHAAGYTHDEQTHPETSEHFGMVTVEAMANGCVPVVLRRGGQVEIVEHGRNGYLWDTLEELQEYTERLTLDPQMLRKLARAARAHATQYSRNTFVSAMTRLLSPYVH
jgi:glycosyltransferase involved in cell wall biosynthesis